MPAQYRCRTTGATYATDHARWRSEVGGLLDIDFVPTLDPEQWRGRPATLWRYREALPLAPEVTPLALGEPVTPLVSLDLDGWPVEVKLDYLYASGSYKDRGAAVLMSLARALGVEQVVQDSSGNAGCAIAHYAAAAGIGCDIYVPASTSPAKLAQIVALGARVIPVPGSREDTAAAARAAAETHFYASHVWQPFFFHGTKTFAYELCEQRGWQAPDTVVLPAGNGTLLIGAWLGFAELRAAGIIGHMPRLVGVQAAGCAPLWRAFQVGGGEAVAGPNQDTVAEGIAIAEPLRGGQMLEIVRDSGGQMLAVDEAEIVAALAWLVRRGYFVEPTSAAVIAGLRQYLHQHAQPGEVVASVLTGHGLKAAAKIEHLLHDH